MRAPAARERALVASVAGRTITVDHLDARVAAIRGVAGTDRLPAEGSTEDLRLRRWVVQLLVTEAVVAHEARAEGIPATPAATPPTGALADMAVRAADRASSGAEPASGLPDGDAVRRLFERVTAGVSVPESDVRAYYRNNPDRYRRPETRRVRHVVVPDEPSARAVLAQVDRGEPLATLAHRLSTDAGSRHRGGDLGAIRRGELVGAFEDAVFAAEPGAIVGPLATEFGWHVVRVEAVTPAGWIPYTDARPAIAADLLAAARGRAFDGWLAQRRADLAVIAPPWVHPGDPRLPDAVHRH